MKISLRKERPLLLSCLAYVAFAIWLCWSSGRYPDNWLLVGAGAGTVGAALWLLFIWWVRGMMAGLR